MHDADPATLIAEIAACVQRFGQTGDVREQDRAVALARLCGDSRAERGNLATVLLGRFEAVGNRPDLVEAESVLLELARSGSIRTDQVSQLARMALHGYELDGDQAKLERSIEISRYTLANALPRDSALADLNHGLARALVDRFDRDGQIGDLDEAIRAYQAAAGADTGSRRLGQLVNIVRQSRRRIELPVPLTDATLLESAIAAADEAAAAFPDDHPLSGELIQASGVLWRYRYEATGDPADVHESLRRLRRAVELPVENAGDRASRFVSLGAALHREFLVTGDPELLQDAIDNARQVLAWTPETDPEHPARLNNLAIVLRARTTYFNDLNALREAIGALREALTLYPRASSRALSVSFLSTTLQDYFHRTGAPEVIDEAVAYARESIQLGNVHREQALVLANALILRHELRGGIGDLEEALNLLHDLLDKLPPGAPGRASCLGVLGRAWRLAFDRTGDLTALDNAIMAFGRAVRADPVTDSDRAEYRRSYARLLLVQHDRVGTTGPLWSAAGAFAAAAADIANSPRNRILAAGHWVDVAIRLGDWPGSLQAARLAMSLLPQVASRRLSRADRERTIAQLSGLAANAAACALQVGDADRAVCWLEQGRGVLLGQILDTRGELGQLRSRMPEAAARLARLDEELATLDVAPEDSERRHATARARDQLLNEIRAVSGFEQFLLPPTVAQVHEWAGPGPVVLLNVSSFRCDALVLVEGKVTAIPLSGLTYDVAAANADRCAEVLDAAYERGREQESGRALAEVLNWLDESVTGPVLDQLDRLGYGGGRVWWCPGGPLTSLPLHAAGTPGRTVMDRVISSYTPTIRALGHARAAAARPARAPGMVTVAVPEPASAAPLPYAEREATAVAELWQATAILGAEATPVRVLDALGRHGYVHFACHGVYDASDPSASKLLLHGEPLSVLEVSQTHLPHARLAVLSACHTARGAAYLPDEALHLAGAFQLAGYPSVVATQWKLNDRIASQIAVAFETAIAAIGMPPAPERAAMMLHEVLLRYRDYPPSVWASWVHSGV
ncbi:CHAT domain-containing protein [Kutzneria sp. NPDC051319]|uniref:CHAT domain-containing protein n=1 Tax=Kutzneria sp. NPDC051319 TaxID=3155047 RepID=UPI003438A298